MQIHLLNAGDFLAELGEWFRVDPAEFPDVAALQTPQRGVYQALALKTDHGVVLIDAPVYDDADPSIILIPDYAPPPPITAQLAAVDIPAESVEQVIITHAHGDHFNGLTVERNGEWQPVFPNAMHYLGEGDWNTMQHKLYKADSLESHTFGVLHRLGKLTLISEETAIVPGVTVIPAPGESAGHQIVRVERTDTPLYHIGDLVHHAIEIEHPDWACWWADRPQHDESRDALIARALTEDALLVASHVAGMGRVARAENGLRWVTAGT